MFVDNAATVCRWTVMVIASRRTFRTNQPRRRHPQKPRILQEASAGGEFGFGCLALGAPHSFIAGNGCEDSRQLETILTKSSEVSFAHSSTARSVAAPLTDQAEDVLDDHVPDKLDSHLDKDEVDNDHLQPRGVRVGALRAQDVEQLPEYALKARGTELENGGGGQMTRSCSWSKLDD